VRRAQRMVPTREAWDAIISPEKTPMKDREIVRLPDDFPTSLVGKILCKKCLILLATPAGFEPATFSLEGSWKAVSDQTRLRLF
jgi:hypothetical protein